MTFLLCGRVSQSTSPRTRAHKCYKRQGFHSHLDLRSSDYSTAT